MNNMATFTTIGPIVFESYSFYKTDTIPNPGDAMRIYIALKNIGSIATATNIESQLISLEPSIKVTNDTRPYQDIAPGEIVQSKYTYNLNIYENCPTNSENYMAIEIKSHDYVFWRDTLSVIVYSSTVIRSNEHHKPKQFILYDNYPNPFNPVTQIKYEISKRSRVVLKVLNLLGHEIRMLVKEEKPAGHYEVLWDGRDKFGQRVANGIYLYRMETQGFVQTRKMLLLQ